MAGELFALGIAIGLLTLLLAWEGYWRIARTVLLVSIFAPLLCAAYGVLPIGPVAALSGCLMAMAWALNSRERKIRRLEEAAAAQVMSARAQLASLREREKALDAETSDVDASISASRSIYQVSRDLGGVITMLELRRELGRLFEALLAPKEALLLYLDIEAPWRRFYRIYDLLSGQRLKRRQFDGGHPVAGYFVDPTSRGIMAMEEGPEGPRRALIYLSHREQVIGGIYLDGLKVGNRQAIEPRVLLYTLAVLVNLASNKCLLYLDIERMSRHDTLTSLYKRWYFTQLMSEELVRCRAEGRTFTVLMLDIDHFKDFNDTHGHLAGDGVLRTVGLFLKEHVRTQDIVCRYGGEEFVLALLDTGRDGGKLVAERLRAGLADRPLTVSGGLTNITVSIGGACFPDDAADLQPLIQLADEAMYRAKQEGRNRVAFQGDPVHV